MHYDNRSLELLLLMRRAADFHTVLLQALARVYCAGEELLAYVQDNNALMLTCLVTLSTLLYQRTEAASLARGAKNTMTRK